MLMVNKARPNQFLSSMPREEGNKIWEYDLMDWPL